MKKPCGSKEETAQFWQAPAHTSAHTADAHIMRHLCKTEMGGMHYFMVEKSVGAAVCTVAATSAAYSTLEGNFAHSYIRHTSNEGTQLLEAYGWGKTFNGQESHNGFLPQ